jgi:hypothetical protein
MTHNNGHFSDKYISMEQFNLNWMFEAGDIEINNIDMARIKPLSKEYSSMIWRKFVSRKNRHLALLEASEWPIQLELKNYNWINDWNENNYSGLLDYLKDIIFIDYKDIIIFFWMKELAVETTIEVFLKYWINFLFESEGTLLINFNNGDAIRFSSSGALYIGKRKVIE